MQMVALILEGGKTTNIMVRVFCCMPKVQMVSKLSMMVNSNGDKSLAKGPSRLPMDKCIKGILNTMNGMDRGPILILTHTQNTSVHFSEVSIVWRTSRPRTVSV